MEALATERPSAPRRPAVLAALLFALTLGLYWRTGSFGFLNFDDDTYVTENEHVRAGLSLESARWAFTSTEAANWHPLTWLSHQLDVELFGLDAGAHHRTNALLHALDAALLLLALAALTGAPARSALVAAFFAWHPLRVESVAWVAERKDLLSAGFAFALLLVWAGYARRGGAARYALALLLYALGLLAKPMGVTLPFVLLLLDAWPLDRVGAGRPGAPPDAAGHPRARCIARSWGALVLEKLPFLALAAFSSVITWRVQHAGGALAGLEGLALDARVANALQAYGTYLAKTLVPTGLSVFHLHPAFLEPERAPWTGAVLAALALLLVVSLALLRVRRRAPFALVGWLWFLGTLVPVVGLVQVGLQAWAERYSYLPSIGLFVALVWGVHQLARTPRARTLALACAAGALLASAAASSVRLGAWRDSRTLFERALLVDEADPIAHNNLGEALEQAGDLRGARRHYARALVLRADLAQVRVNLARAQLRLGRAGEARAELERALADEPELARAHADLGLLLARLEQDTEALAHLRRARELLPEDEEVRDMLAWVLATTPAQAAPAEALALVEAPCARPDADPGTLETGAAALARLGRFTEALAWQARALELRPGTTTRERLELYRAQRAFVRQVRTPTPPSERP